MQQEYKVIKESSLSELERSVCQALNEQDPGTTGWRLQGGVMYHTRPGEAFWAQAMHREAALGF